MNSAPSLSDTLAEAADTYPYPIAAACVEVLETEPRDPWHEWELLSRDVLTPILSYSSHLLLSDLVARGENPPHLFHRIKSILSSPLAGHYVGFLRETAAFYRDENIDSAVPELVGFLSESEIESSLTDSGKPLLGTLVDYRNLWAHGRVGENDSTEKTLTQVRDLTRTCLRQIHFLADYSLTLEDGSSLMGSSAEVPEEPLPLVVVTAGEVSLRPLLLKLEGSELSLLTEVDLQRRRISYRGQNSFTEFTEENLDEDEEVNRIFSELKELIGSVRALQTTLPSPDLESFEKRTSVQTEEMLSLYGETDLQKYVPELYISRPEWEEDEGYYWSFLDSDKTLLAIDGEQGSGKSALAARLASLSRQEDHIVWFLNAQRFTYADVSWEENPYPRYFADQLHYQAPLDYEAMKELSEETEEGQQIIFFVDAINEVSPLNKTRSESGRWNQFKAMDRLLEWARTISPVDVKVVLTFRTSSYEKFGYFESERLPKYVDSISWSYEETEKWYCKINEFSQGQCQELYSILQELPEKGMSPNMTWGTVKSQLGEKIEKFTSNPLLFRMFLRANHQRDSIVDEEPQKLYEDYARGIVRDEDKEDQGWWKFTYDFFKDANLTEKERLLGDLVNKMTSLGKTSVLLSELDPRASDEDYRIQETVTRPEKREAILNDLKEVGMITEEHIELDQEGKVEKRISFNNEIVGISLDKVSQRINLRDQLRSGIISVIFVISLLASIIYLFWYSRSFPLDNTASEVKVKEIENIIGVVWSEIGLTGTIFSLILLPPVISLIITPHRKTWLPSEVGLTEHYFTSKIEDRLGKATKFLGLITFVFTSVVILLVYAGYSPLFLWISLFTSFFATVLFLINSDKLSTFLVADFSIQPQLITVLSSRTLDSLANVYDFNSYYIRYLPSLILSIFSVSLFLFSENLLLFFYPPIFDAIPQSIAQIAFMMKLYTTYSNFYYGIAGSLFIPIVLTLIFSTGIFSFIFSDYLDYFWKKIYLENLRSIDTKHTFSAYSFFSTVVTFFAFIFLISNLTFSNLAEYEYFSSGKLHSGTDKKYDNVAMEVADKVPTLKGNVTIGIGGNLELEADSVKISGSQLDRTFIYNFDRLYLNRNIYPDVSLRKWGSLRQLILSGDSINLVDNEPISRLRLLDIRTSHASGFSRVGDLYPHLLALRVSEDVVLEADAFPNLWSESFISVRSDGAPDLSWLDKELGKHTIELSQPPTSQSKNLNHITRLIVPAEGLKPEVLEKMNSLTWLRLKGSPCEDDSTDNDISSWCTEIENAAQHSADRSVNVEHEQGRNPYFESLKFIL